MKIMNIPIELTTIKNKYIFLKKQCYACEHYFKKERMWFFKTNDENIYICKECCRDKEALLRVIVKVMPNVKKFFKDNLKLPTNGKCWW